MENNDKLDTTQVVEDEQESQVDDKEVVEEEVKEEESNEDAQEATQEEESTDSHDESDSQEDDEESETDKEFTNALKKVRNEAKNLRTRLKDANATIEKLRAESNEELVKERDDLAKQLQDLKLEVRTDKTRGQVIAAATKANAVEPAAVADALMAKVKYDDSDKPTNIDKIIDEYKKTYKRLFSGAVGNGNIGNRNERGSEFEGMSAKDTLTAAFSSNE